MSSSHRWDAYIEGEPKPVAKTPAERQRAYRLRHPDWAAESKRAYAERNTEGVRESRARYEATHPEYKREKNRRYQQSENGRQVKARLRSEWKERHADYTRERARIMSGIRYALTTGVLVKHPCQTCGDPVVHAHHHMGYAPENELNVVWLCLTHHVEAHR